MAKITDVYLKNTHGAISITYAKKGIIAKVARKLYNRYPKHWLFNLGYDLHSASESVVIGEVIDAENGVIKIGGQDG